MCSCGGQNGSVKGCSSSTSDRRHIFFYMAQLPLAGHGLIIVEASRSYSDTPHSVVLSVRVISQSQRPLPDNTQHSQETDIHAPGGIRTRNPSKRTAANPRLRPRGHWDRLFPRLNIAMCVVPRFRTYEHLRPRLHDVCNGTGVTMQ